MKQTLSLSIGFIALVHIVFALWCFPVFSGDTECFLPTSYALQYGKGLYNPFYTAGLSLNGAFNFYPPLYPFIMGLFLMTHSLQALYLEIAVVNILSILFTALAIFKIIGKEKPSTINTLLIIASVFCLGAFATPANTRPELLVRLLFALMLFFESYKFTSRYLLFGLLSGITLLTSPLPGLYSYALSALFLLKEEQLRNYGKIAQFFVGSLLVLFGFLLMYPFGILEMLKSIQAHSKNVVFSRNDAFSLGNFMTYHVVSAKIVLGICIPVLALWMSIKENRSHRTGWLMNAGILAFSIFVSYFSLKVLPMNYYLYVLSPLFVYVIAVHAVKQSTKPLKWVALVLMVLNTVPLMRYGAIFGAMNAQNNGYLSVENTSKILHKYRNLANNNSIAISASLWPFFAIDSISPNVKIYNTGDTSTQFIIKQQYGSQQSQPQEISGYKIVDNQFTGGIHVKNYQLAQYAPMYQFCVYEKIQQ